ncbi:hypothetical protein PV416_31170 [Streptomyces ipomoeae]|uniref:hypothetical protein n=1 Tax=Streptomyces ipomoeae TaxID=103232 RepID=UPI0029A0A9EC|nr:hypothetical protein [Streptomyces ipomoeae]MDX2825419.1 hypothetical protein [Streptomyces ipomoeae]MDX2878027.1 hypothetical protein [Streptomyces ipomoeae]
MRRLFRQIACWLRVFTVPTGRHRARFRPGPHPPQESQPGPLRALIAPTVQAWYEPIDGASTRLVRPYLAAHEREEKARIQRLRRDTLWCATYGVDLDNRDIHAWLEAV